MKKIFCSALLCSALLGVNAAQASVVYFDDLDPTIAGGVQVPDHYNGFVWGAIGNSALTAISDLHWTSLGNYGNVGNGSPSGEYAVTNFGIVNVMRSNNAIFDFTGAFFSPFTTYNDLNSQGDTATTIVVEGYNGAALVGTASMDFLTAGYSWLQADIQGITLLKISGISPFVQPYQTRWVMDNFTFETAAPVPAPAAIWLMGSGLLVLLSFRRKFTQA